MLVRIMLCLYEKAEGMSSLSVILCFCAEIRAQSCFGYIKTVAKWDISLEDPLLVFPEFFFSTEHAPRLMFLMDGCR